MEDLKQKLKELTRKSLTVTVDDIKIIDRGGPQPGRYIIDTLDRDADLRPSGDS